MLAEISPTCNPATIFEYQPESFFGDFDQLFSSRCQLTNTNRDGRISHETLKDCPAIHADNITFHQLAFTGDAMHQFFIYAGADAGRIRVWVRGNS